MNKHPDNSVASAIASTPVRAAPKCTRTPPNRRRLSIPNSSSRARSMTYRPAGSIATLPGKTVTAWDSLILLRQPGDRAPRNQNYCDALWRDRGIQLKSSGHEGAGCGRLTCRFPICPARTIRCKGVLVSRFRSSHDFAAHSQANFGIEGHSQLIDLVWLWFRSPHLGLGGRE